MHSGQTREIAAGAVFIASGLFFGGFALAQLKLGSFAQMGPGMFPFLIGVALLAIGIGQVLASLNRAAATEAGEPVEWRALIFVVLAMLAFAPVIAWFGVVPAIFVLVAIASQAAPRLTLRAAVLLGAGLSVAAWLIFVRLLGLTLALVRWPF